MMYYCQKIKLQSILPDPVRLLLAARLRQFQGIVSASVGEQEVSLYSRPERDVSAVVRQIRTFEKCYGEQPLSTAEAMASFKRDTILSIGAFTAMVVLRKAVPETFKGMLLFRRLLVLVIARRFIQNGLSGLWKEHRANADTLTATAVAASVLAGKPESSLTLLALSNGAEMLTGYAAERARKHISGLLKLDQRDVWLMKDGKETKVPVEAIQAGACVAVHLGEKICVDGRVIGGSAAVNQASITGESNPSIKSKGASVYAGSVIEAGDIEVLVEKVGKDTSLARIIHLVEEAQTRKAPVQNFADKMANLLVPVSFLGAAIVYGATRDWQRALNLLFIDYSCGLKLSTATAISAAVGVAARRGILVKGGNYIEALADIDTVILDKTGTITMGIPQVSHIDTASEIDEKEMILLAASAEMHSVHPLAVAVQKYVQKQKWTIPQHSSSHTVVARGMVADVPAFENYAGGHVVVGSRRFMEEKKIAGLDEFIQKEDKENLLYVACDGKLLGVMAIHDPVRPTMKKTLNQMRRAGVDEIIMLTGDSKEVAAEVARNMDIDSYHAEILPEDKAEYVLKLQKNGHVMMVGDGINDAPALAFSDVGISLGGNQTDIAVESSAVTIHSEEPGKLMEALQIGHQTMNIINQNFTATIVVNSAAMLLGALGKISPLWSAVIHNTATLAVVLNSVRILRTGWRQQDDKTV